MFKNNSIIFAGDREKLDILKTLDEKSLFLSLRFMSPTQELGHFDNRYYFFMKEEFDITYDLAKKLRKYFAYLIQSCNYESKRLNMLKDIKQRLLDKGIYKPLDEALFKRGDVYSINDTLVPGFICNDVKKHSIGETCSKSAELIVSSDGIEACQSVFQIAKELLEEGKSPEDLVILNTDKTDDFHLEKLFNDANIPINFHKSEAIRNHPKIIELVKLIIKGDLEQVKKHINESLSDDLHQTVLNLFNRYPDSLIEKHPDVFISILKDTKMKPRQYSGFVKVMDFEDVTIESNKAYLVMNYTNDTLCTLKTNHDYLTESEAKEIGYFTIQEINEAKIKEIRRLLDSMPFPYLFFPKVKEGENLLPDIGLNRQIIKKEYIRDYESGSYFQTLDKLDYAKAKYDRLTYNQSIDGYEILRNTFEDQVSIHSHEFTGIGETTLSRLLANHNTLSGAKLETYHLCHFQFLLKHLMKMSKNETRSSQVMGSITHKVLEEILKQKNLGVDELVMGYLDFPEAETHKEKVFRTALLEEIRKLLEIFTEFHEQTGFNLVNTEIEFSIPYQDFFITGVIDKVMVLKNEGEHDYFILVDYKINQKDFVMEEFKAGRMLQLPVYLYAFMKLNPENTRPAGIYYQTTGLGRYKKEEDSVRKHYELKGISLDSPAILQKLSNDLTHLRGMALTKDGNLRKNEKRIFSQQELSYMKKEVENMIEEVIKKLRLGDFAINPMPSYGRRKDSVSCEYCEFAHVCYNKNRGLGGEEE